MFCVGMYVGPEVARKHFYEPVFSKSQWLYLYAHRIMNLWEFDIRFSFEHQKTESDLFNQHVAWS